MDFDSGEILQASLWDKPGQLTHKTTNPGETCDMSKLWGSCRLFLNCIHHRSYENMLKRLI